MEDQGPKSPLYLNEYCDDAQQRSEFFYNFVKSHSLTLLPGRYGGEYNNDHVALGEQDGELTVYFGTKIMPAGEGIQLDKFSMGPFMQGSVAWLKMIIQAMKACDGLPPALLEKFERSIEDGRISVVVFYVDIENSSLSLLPLAVEDWPAADVEKLD